MIKYIKSLIILISILTGLSVNATTWYVDSSATGSHNGTSWTNAWTALSQISGITAGDTVYISGGANGSSQNYSVSNWKPTAGNSTSKITYQIGQDSLHNGTANFSGSSLWLTAPSYIVISGDAGDGKQHFALSGYGQAANINGTTGLHLAYINLGSSSGSLNDGLDGQGLSSFELDHCYAYIVGAGSDHFMSVGFNGTTYHQNLIHDNVIYIPHQSGASGDGADGFQFGGIGYSLYNNLVVGYDTTYTGGQHQDGWQSTGPDSYLEFYGNTFINIGNYALFADAYWGGFTHLRVYNNLFFMGGNYVYPGAIVFGTDGGYTGTSPCQYNDIVIANNMADGFGTQGTVVLENPTGSTHPTVFVGDVVANNVSINGGHLSYNNDNTVVSLDNIFLTTAQGPANFISYSSTGATNNNFHLLASATTLIGKGTNLSTYFTTDKDGNIRPSNGNWDLGLYVYNTNNIVTNPPPAPIISVSPLSINFNTTLTNNPISSSITVSNSGGGTLTGSATTSYPFTILTGSSYSLNANSSQLITLSFNPTNSGTFNKTVTLTGGNGATVNLSGIATNLPINNSGTNYVIITNIVYQTNTITITQYVTLTNTVTLTNIINQTNTITLTNYITQTNIINYGSLTIPLNSGFNLIADPFAFNGDTTNNTLQNIMGTNWQDGTTIYSFIPSLQQFINISIASGIWGTTNDITGIDPSTIFTNNPIFLPGGGFFIYTPAQTSIGFTGTISTNPLTLNVIRGIQIVSFPFITQENVTNISGIGIGTSIETWNGSDFNNYSKGKFGKWNSEPNIIPGEAFYLTAPANGTITLNTN